ncbi:hypothetical protein [Amphritea sp.]|uniref:hypothetical protein n=1 Tax=Amphritea sp. TaxID=1872502 RepID=UPI0025B91936|nr:hypothetical protein [Amphritea sp.]
MRFILLVLGPILLAGCSTAQIPLEEAKLIPKEHIYNNTFLKHEAGNELVHFIRDQGLIGAGCSHTVFIDNEKAFAIQPGQAISVSLKPGNHFFRLDLGAGLCPNESHSKSTYLNLGEPQTFRISISSGGTLMLTRIK